MGCDSSWDQTWPEAGPHEGLSARALEVLNCRHNRVHCCQLITQSPENKLSVSLTLLKAPACLQKSIKLNNTLTVLDSTLRVGHCG